LPIWCNGYYCIAKFYVGFGSINFTIKNNFNSLSFKIITDQTQTLSQTQTQTQFQTPRPVKVSSPNDLKLAAENFNKGTQFLINGNYEKAIANFSATLKIDSLYIDAYYNRATAFYKLGNKAAACVDWKTLTQLEQKEGEKLYIENCKE